MASVIALGTALVACSDQGQEAAKAPDTTGPTAELTKTEAGMSNITGLNAANRDTTVAACTDFYQYANGGWLKNNEIPAAYRRWGGFNEINNRNQERLKTMLQTAAADTQAKPGSNQQKIGDFYASAMDTAAIEAAGATPLDKDFERIAALSSKDDLVALLADYAGQGMNFVFNAFVNQDAKDSTRYIVYATQGGLGLPDRDYYTKEDEDSQKLRDKYLVHVAKMLVLLGDTQEAADKNAATIMEIETALAKASMTRVERRKAENRYDLMSVADAAKITPDFSWSAYFGGMGIGDTTEFSLTPGSFFKAMDKQIAGRSLDDWKTYLRWHLITNAAPFLSEAFVNENFDFFAKTLSGAKELQPRWRRALGSTNGVLGEALGELFVAQAFPPEYKARALEMIENLRWAIGDSIKKLDWMGDETKQKALAKLASFTPKIGYPDKFRDYSAYNVDRGIYIDNMRRGQAFEARRNLNKLGKPIDKGEWGMFPHQVNAYYNPLKNEIVFPAGIMQPPFFDGRLDDAFNYGAMGGVIGHEFLHGFDDQGSKFDADGNLKNWWTEDDRKLFDARTDKLVAQYDAYEPLEGVHVNGRLTLGENIGDLGGITMAYRALQKARGGKADPMIDGLTQNQRFFFSWAQVWRAKSRPKFTKMMVNLNPHSPPQYRGNGPLTNLPGFYEAFGCKDGDAMYKNPDERVTIW